MTSTDYGTKEGKQIIGAKKKRVPITSISSYSKGRSLDFCQKDGGEIYRLLEELENEIPDKLVEVNS